MPLSRRIPLVLISGFLGSGKTTFLNNLFDSFPDLKFGIIVNDFGSLGVDASVIRRPAGSIISELNNGQIFCSCLAGSFVDSVSAYADRDIDYLLVETSGLAKPSPLMDIIAGIKKINGERFSYYGMISIVDSSTYLRLSEVLNAVDEQIQYSNLVLINKIDLASAGDVEKTEARIMSINPEAVIEKTSFAKMPADLFLSLDEKKTLPDPDDLYSGWGGSGRPVPLILKSREAVLFEALEGFIAKVRKQYFRLKGYIETDRGLVFVDCTAGSTDIIENADNGGGEYGLVMIIPADKDIIEAVKKNAAAVFTSVS